MATIPPPESRRARSRSTAPGSANCEPPNPSMKYPRRIRPDSSTATGVVKVSEKARPPGLEVPAQPLMQVRVRRGVRFRDQPGSVPPQVEGDLSVARSQRAAADPDHLAHRDQLVEQPRAVATDTSGDHVALDHARRESRTLELEYHLEQPVHATGLGAYPMPGRKEAGDGFGRHRFDLVAKRRQGAPPEDLQHVRVAVFASLPGAPELAGG